MRRPSNLSQWMGIYARDARSGTCATRVGTTVFDTAVMRIGSCDVGASVRERALAGLSI